jgi:hypothetical protein
MLSSLLVLLPEDDSDEEEREDLNAEEKKLRKLPKNKTELYKTELCSNWVRTRNCSYGTTNQPTSPIQSSNLSLCLQSSDSFVC